jgi:hypothetical protein
MSNEKEWYNNLEQIKQYIDKNYQRPSARNKNKKIKQMGSWISTQQKNYKKKTYIMKNQAIYDKWTEFINDDKYRKFF